MKAIQVLLAVSALHLPVAQAALLTEDSPAGPATAVLDTNTGLVWLKLSVTENTAINQVLAESAPGGRLEGFGYATVGAFCEFISTNAGVGCRSRTEDVDRVSAFFSVIGGPRLSPDDGFGSIAALDPPTAENRMAYASSFRLYSEPSPHYETDLQAVTANAQLLAEPSRHWLVREAHVVPEASSLALLGLGAAVLAGLRRKRPGP